MLKIKDYLDTIRKLPLKNSYTKEDILIPEFLVNDEKNIQIYYCTHNEYVNFKAKIFIIGITPGFGQMNKSIVAARKCIEEGVPIGDIPYICKKEARFEGSMRKNIIAMLNELELGKKFDVIDAKMIFNERDDLLHTTSIIPYAVFVNGKNYTGHQPPMLKNEVLLHYVKEHFYPQIELMKDSLIIPLGKSVEEVLIRLIEEKKITENQCLLGFPHPSGANAHRYKQFEENKKQMRSKILKYGGV